MLSIPSLLNRLRNQVWEVRLSEMHPLKAFFVKQLRIILIVFRNFSEDKLPVTSAGLTFYTILSVVPVVALAFAVAKGFGLENKLNEQLTEMFRGQEDAVSYIMLYANRMLENTQGGLLAGIGVAILLWTVIRLLSNIERAFNDIWQVAKGRSWIRKFTDYFSIMLMAPIIIVVAGSLTVMISGKLANLIEGVDLLESIGPILFFFVRLIPYALIWLVFTMVYLVMPNTRVSFKSALVAGIIAGTCFQVLEWGYINFQVGVSRYNAIYGSFAALPLFMVWANFSWLITLVGSEIAYANQCLEEIEPEVRESDLSQTDKKSLAVIMCQHVFAAFDEGKPPYTALRLSQTLDIHFAVVNKILELLVQAGVLIEVESGQTDMCYQPARNIERISISDIFQSIDDVGSKKQVRILEDPKTQPYFKHFEALRVQIKASSDDLLVKDLPAVTINE